jgi:hypothetical protein
MSIDRAGISGVQISGVIDKLIALASKWAGGVWVSCGFSKVGSDILEGRDREEVVV